MSRILAALYTTGTGVGSVACTCCFQCLDASSLNGCNATRTTELRLWLLSLRSHQARTTLRRLHTCSDVLRARFMHHDCYSFFLKNHVLYHSVAPTCSANQNKLIRVPAGRSLSQTASTKKSSILGFHSPQHVTCKHQSPCSLLVHFSVGVGHQHFP